MTAKPLSSLDGPGGANRAGPSSFSPACDGCEYAADRLSDRALELEIAERRNDWGTVRAVGEWMRRAARDLNAAAVLQRVVARSET